MFNNRPHNAHKARSVAEHVVQPQPVLNYMISTRLKGFPFATIQSCMGRRPGRVAMYCIIVQSYSEQIRGPAISRWMADAVCQGIIIDDPPTGNDAGLNFSSPCRPIELHKHTDPQPKAKVSYLLFSHVHLQLGGCSAAEVMRGIRDTLVAKQPWMVSSRPEQLNCR